MALSLLAANNAQTVLAAGISSTATSLTVNAGTGTLFPPPVAGTSFFKLTIIDAATGSLTEIVHVTARAGDVFTIQRGQEGTVPRAWSANDIAANMMTAGTLSYILGNFQPLDPTLTALAALVGVANKLPYFNGDDTAALTDLTQVGRDIIGKSDIAAVLQYLGLENVLRADHASFAGFESNNPAIPYMRHVTTDAVIRLATTTALQNGLNDKQDKDATLTTLSGKDANGILQYLGYESGSEWVKLPGGLIIQRGRIGHQVGITSVLVTLPRAFTSLEYSVAQSWSDVQNIATGDTQNPASNGTQFSSRTLTTFQSWQAGPGGFNTDYIAIGY
ncbi:hypothetical protein [Citrobacter freundii complex sp. 2024EL-00216]|uniref:gp53-like domain-containing protein n=1 Tax=Citrobacter freundii complex sp. 2024EL-00216 TaxID=3374258 RepID=UPI00375253AA